jgi:hypothetical protein
MTQLSNAYAVALLSPESADSPLIWRTQENGKMVEYHKEPSRSLWRRIRVGFLTVLPLDKEL